MINRFTKKIREVIHNNRRPLTVLVQSITIFLSALLGGVISLIFVKINIDLEYLAIFALIVLILIVLVTKFWDWYDKPARLQQYEQINHIETHVNLIEEDLKEIKKFINDIRNRIKY